MPPEDSLYMYSTKILINSFELHIPLRDRFHWLDCTITRPSLLYCKIIKKFCESPTTIFPFISHKRRYFCKNYHTTYLKKWQQTVKPRNIMKLLAICSKVWYYFVYTKNSLYNFKACILPTFGVHDLPGPLRILVISAHHRHWLEAQLADSIRAERLAGASIDHLHLHVPPDEADRACNVACGLEVRTAAAHLGEACRFWGFLLWQYRKIGIGVGKCNGNIDTDQLKNWLTLSQCFFFNFSYFIVVNWIDVNKQILTWFVFLQIK